MARLILESGGERREIKIAGPVTIGRSSQATIHIDDKILSREHTRVYPEGGSYLVKDLDSKNGTFLNGALLRQTEALKSGDKLRVGQATLTFLLDPSDAPAKPSAPPAAAPARARPRASQEPAASGMAPAARFIGTLFLLAAVVVGAYFFKEIFRWVLGRIPS